MEGDNDHGEGAASTLDPTEPDIVPHTGMELGDGSGDMTIEEKETVVPPEEHMDVGGGDAPTSSKVELSALAPCFYPREYNPDVQTPTEPAMYYMYGDPLPTVNPYLPPDELQGAMPLLGAWWNMWVIRTHQKRSRWGDNLAPLILLQSLPAFIRVWEDIDNPGPLNACGYDYACFRHGVKPMWESDENKYGGHFRIPLGKNAPRDMIRDKWMQTLLCIVGSGFQWYGVQVTGAVAGCRARGNRIEVWTEDADQEVAIRSIGIQLKDIWDIPSRAEISYFCHADIFDCGQQEAMKNPRYRI